jgi:hypothetical protein
MAADTKVSLITGASSEIGEARRVTRGGGLVAVCVWGPAEANELGAVMASLRGLAPTPPAGPPLGAPGALEAAVGRAGLDPLRPDHVDVPLDAGDDAALVAALLASGAAVPAIEHAGEDAAAQAVLAAARPFRRRDGSYRLENAFRYVVAAA